jgi:hypothetical protein
LIAVLPIRPYLADQISFLALVYIIYGSLLIRIIRDQIYYNAARLPSAKPKAILWKEVYMQAWTVAGFLLLFSFAFRNLLWVPLVFGVLPLYQFQVRIIKKAVQLKFLEE